MAMVKKLCLILIQGYQIFLSPLKLPCCRYYPTCSEYARLAVEKYGVRRGGWLALRRILRCHPFHAGGYDPVPEHLPDAVGQEGFSMTRDSANFRM